MKPGGGRRKGSAFERKVAKMVVTAFSCFGITKVDVYRTPLSGGHIYARESDPGDLVISPKLRKYFPFHVEAKAYKQVSLNALFTPIDKQPKAWKFRKWVEQVLKATEKQNGLSYVLTPVIVFKENNGPVLALLPSEGRFKKPPVFQTTYKGKVWDLILFSRLLRYCVRTNGGNV